MIYTPKTIVLRWLQVGKREGATHMLLVEDSLADETIPVYVARGENLDYKISRFNDARLTHVVAVFDLFLNLEKQLDTVYP